MRTTLALAVLLASNAQTLAGMITVDFEAVEVDGELQVLPGGIFNGLRFVEPSGLFAKHLIDNGGCAVGCTASGTTSLLYEGAHGVGQPALRIDHPAGLPFRLLSFDAGEAITAPVSIPYNAVGIGLIGTLSAGGTITTLLELDGVLDGTGGVDDFESFTLPSEFADAVLKRIDVWGLYDAGRFPFPGGPDIHNSRAGFSLDNVAFDVIGDHVDFTLLPEPTSLVLLLIGLCGSCLHRRR